MDHNLLRSRSILTEETQAQGWGPDGIRGSPNSQEDPESVRDSYVLVSPVIVKLYPPGRQWKLKQAGKVFPCSGNSRDPHGVLAKNAIYYNVLYLDQ